jgi:tRNA-dihydrouridine synthase C
MIGRGAVADPFLARRIRLRVDGGIGNPASGNNDDELARDWAQLSILLQEFWQRVRLRMMARHAPGRLKLWLSLLRRGYPQAEALYRGIRACDDVDTVSAALAAATAVE